MRGAWMFLLLMAVVVVAGAVSPALGDGRFAAPRAEVHLPPEEEGSSAAVGALAADLWSHPLTPWSVSQHSGVWRSGYGYHLGDDVIKPAYTAVRNARWGYVRHVGWHSGYGWVVIVESPVRWEPSTDPRTWKNPVCQVYGHLRNDSYLAATKAKLGRSIDRGWIVGRLGTSSENGGWAPHLHYGIRKGRYTTSWVYWGYTTSPAIRDTWYHPCSIIASY